MSTVGDLGLEPRSDSLYSDIIEHCADAVVILNADRRIAYLNKSAERMFGRAAATVVGKSLEILIPETARERHRVHVRRFQEADERSKFMDSRGIDILALRADGSEFPVSVSILKSGAGADRRLVAIVRDISAQKQLEQRLSKLASTDPLTGLLNRRAFLRRLDEECARSQRYGNPMVLAMIDIDHFKHVNDSFGHLAGDHAIRHVVDTVAGGLRVPDVLARWGGEEFALILPETDGKAASTTAERLRQSVEDAPLVDEPVLVDDIRLTVSIGLADFRVGRDAIEDLIGRADRALYAAKEAGRNRVMLAAG